MPDPLEPLALIADHANGPRLQAVNRAAAALRLRPAMPLAEARALAPGLRALPADLARDRAKLGRLAEWCGRYSPWVGIEKNAAGIADGLCLDISGCGHLFGGPAGLLHDLSRRLKNFGLSARTALAPTPAAAWALACYGAQDQTLTTPENLQAQLAPLACAALKLDGETLIRLTSVGLYRIGDLVLLPRGALARRFGASLLKRLDQALGVIADPLEPHTPPPAYRLRLDFAEPIGRVSDIELALGRLLDPLCAWLGQAGRGARTLHLTLYRVDGEAMRRAIGVVRPSRDPRRLARLFAEKIADLDPGFGVETLILAASRTEALPPAPRALALSGEDKSKAADDLAALIDRLAARLGPGQVLRLAPADSHIPERAVTLQPIGAGAPPSRGAWPNGVPRPVRLLPCPEPIEVTAGAADDAAPAEFYWRRVRHAVARAQGPERIGPEWWRGGSATRDYWRVEDDQGRRFWLYRAMNEPPRWYVHGLFA